MSNPKTEKTKKEHSTTANKHFFFVDDSGSKDWETPYSKDFANKPPARTEQNINFWRRNYFVLARGAQNE